MFFYTKNLFKKKEEYFLHSLFTIQILNRRQLPVCCHAISLCRFPSHFGFKYVIIIKLQTISVFTVTKNIKNNTNSELQICNKCY